MSEADTERPKTAKSYPDDERGRKVWAEVYPGGDMQIELGGIRCDEELYLSPGEPEALLEVLEDLVGGSDE